MVLKNINEIIQSPPLICGEFKTIDEVAEYVSKSHHSVLLSGYLLYAYKGDNGIKSLIITTKELPNKFMISIFYDNYNMIYTALMLESLELIIKELETDKKLKILCDTLKIKFYEDDM